ncbi:MAG TPA: hypothetical protein VMQ56_12910 [Terracidiphilus sp.]|jgi:hypothetical protein|nr:hypothetical protein [Terracidiphilus sp.]
MNIHPIQHSMAPRLRRTPSGMSRANLPPELREFIESEAIEIFTIMVNGEATFQASLAAVYLSGVDAGIYGANEHHQTQTEGQNQ